MLFPGLAASACAVFCWCLYCMQTKETVILEWQGCFSSSFIWLLWDYKNHSPPRQQLLTRCSAASSQLKQRSWARNRMSENTNLQTAAAAGWAFPIPSPVRGSRRLPGSSQQLHGLLLWEGASLPQPPMARRARTAPGAVETGAQQRCGVVRRARCVLLCVYHLP